MAQKTKIWDRPESIAHDKLRLAVHNARRAADVVIIEGFQALHDLSLLHTMDVCVMLNLSRDICRMRRLAGGCSALYFDKHVWPNPHAVHPYPHGTYRIGCQETHLN